MRNTLSSLFTPAQPRGEPGIELGFHAQGVGCLGGDLPDVDPPNRAPICCAATAQSASKLGPKPAPELCRVPEEGHLAASARAVGPSVPSTWGFEGRDPRRLEPLDGEPAAGVTIVFSPGS